MKIIGVGQAFPPTYVSQDEILAALRRRWPAATPRRVEDLFRNTRVEGRHLALPVADYDALRGFGDANDAFLRVATDLAASALRDALDGAGLEARDVDVLLCATVTGLAVPSLDARLVNRLGLRTDVTRVPLVGLGCVAGAAGIARAADLVRGWPGRLAAVVCVELCSLTIQTEDTGVPSLVAAALFGDGAACALVAGVEHAATRGPRIVATRSSFYPDTEQVMGWRVDGTGFHVLLSGEVPHMVSDHLRGDVEGFLADHGLGVADIRRWIAHPGGPKVLEAMEASFALPKDALAPTWDSLRRLGNLSSASVVSVLHDVLAGPPPAPGEHGLLLAMGPGFCAELVLLRWDP